MVRSRERAHIVGHPGNWTATCTDQKAKLEGRENLRSKWFGMPKIENVVRTTGMPNTGRPLPFLFSGVSDPRPCSSVAHGDIEAVSVATPTDVVAAAHGVELRRAGILRQLHTARG